MFYEIDQMALDRRYFSKEILYSQIDWKSLDEVVDAFDRRIRDWYIDPLKALCENIHFSFSIMAINCLLVDTLSQFVAGITVSNGDDFKTFVRTELPRYAQPLPTSIRHFNGRQRERALLDVADVLYHGFRCGILHQAHIFPYGGIAPQATTPVRVDVNGTIIYRDSGAHCPNVVIDPRALVADLDDYFMTYIGTLKDRDSRFDSRRHNFKTKFSHAFGIDVMAAQ